MGVRLCGCLFVHALNACGWFVLLADTCLPVYVALRAAHQGQTDYISYEDASLGMLWQVVSIHGDWKMPVYAARVKASRELSVCHQMQEAIERLGSDRCKHSKCIVPQSEISKRYSGGEWRNEAVVLFVGYVLVDTKTPDECDELFGSVADCYGLLSQNRSFQCLTREEVIRLSIWTDQVDHLLGMSQGVLDENGKALVIKGPLKGREVDIVKLNRHKRFAVVEVGFLGRTMTVKVGLEILASAVSQ